MDSSRITAPSAKPFASDVFLACQKVKVGKAAVGRWLLRLGNLGGRQLLSRAKTARGRETLILVRSSRLRGRRIALKRPAKTRRRHARLYWPKRKPNCGRLTGRKSLRATVEPIRDLTAHCILPRLYSSKGHREAV